MTATNKAQQAAETEHARLAPVLSLADWYREASQEEMLAKRDRQCPMGHMGDAWDVATTALWLASDESKYVTSAEIMVDGGISARIG